MKRRAFLMAPCLAALGRGAGTSPPASRRGKRLGVVIHSYSKRWQGRYSSIQQPPFTTALDVLDHLRGLGAGSLQISVAGWSDEMAGRVRDTRESYGMRLEGSITLPKTEADVPRFERELRLGKEAGAVIYRSALGGRRYEQFSTREQFRSWKEAAWRSMQLAEPAARRQRVRIGVENHKDFHAPELVELLTRLSSEHIGCTIDTGNSIALLEEPLAVVEALAPFVVTTHIKDMAVQEYEHGFLLSEVPLGEGMLDLPRLLEILEKGNPRVEHHLEMITRDPLEIPCLKERYWATFPDKPGTELARTLSMVRAKKAARLPKVTGRSIEDALAFEEENIVKSLQHAGEALGFDNVQIRRPTDEKNEK
ncbi:MAG: TIM barrel protein [Verrucomicrobiaceae bacterium]|jgi:sugar phosphate isomerase/epimerase|nr:TIM barrel protein [Verrucomicrobiaceae bacterium]